MPRPRTSPSAVPLDEEGYISAEVTALDALLSNLEFNPREIIPDTVDPAQIEDEALAMGQSLKLFIPKAWPLVEPSTFIPNWHIDAIAEHLEAVTAGDIQDLLITMPPRHSKSLLVSVLWPAWEWINNPSYRWMFASYAFNLSVRDSIKRRKIIQSQFYQQRWADRFYLVDEQNTKIKYENNKHGFMMASSVGGSNTGEGGERIIADDPHNVKKTESADVRQDTVDWWNIVMSTRRNSASAARVVVQQRTHEADVAGDIIEKGGYVHLNLPTEFGFAGSSRCHTGWTHAGSEVHWADPRTEEGELLNPKRFDHVQNEKAKIDLGDYQYAAQHGQNPTPPKGQIIQAQWLRYYGGPGQPPVPDWPKASNYLTPLLSIDCAFKEGKDTDFVAGLGMAMFGADIYIMPICIHKRMNFPDTIDAVAEFVGGSDLEKTKTYPGIYPFIKMKLVEAKANGSAVIDTLQHRIPGMYPFEPGGDNKEARLRAGSWRFKAGNIYLPDESIAPWVKEYVYELCAFPKARKDDFVDATSQALIFIGGDAVAPGEPIATPHTSSWIGVGDYDIEGERDSIWGAVGGSNRSVWRQ